MDFPTPETSPSASAEGNTTVRIDFQKVALNIRSSGMPLARAAKRIGRHQAWLQEVARGDVRSVEFHDGLALLDLHLDLVGPEQHRSIMKEDAK